MEKSFGNRRAGHDVMLTFTGVIIFFLLVTIAILLYVGIFAQKGNAAAVQGFCTIQDNWRSKLSGYGTPGEVIADLSMPVHPACGEIIDDECSPKEACISNIQYYIKSICWVRGKSGGAGGEVPCINSLPIGDLGGNKLTPADICGPNWKTNLNDPANTCKTPATGTPPGIDTGVPNGRMTWAPVNPNDPEMKAIKGSAITMRYVAGKIEISCISAYKECLGVPTPI